MLDKLENNIHLNVVGGVVVLFDGSLFLRQKNHAQQQFEHMLGDLEIKNTSIQNFLSNMESNICYADASSCKYCHIIFPAKPIAYRNEFSSIGLDIKPIVKNEYLGTHCFYPDVENLKSNYFIKDGSHCTCEGYLSIIEPVMLKLGYSFDSVQFEYGTTSKVSDLGRMIGGEPIDRRYIVGVTGQKRIRNFSNLSALSGNTGEFRIRINLDAVFKQRILLFGDSFFVGCMSILSALFQEVIYIRKPYIEQEFARRLQPDVILTGNAERYLVNVPDCNYDKPYFLYLINPSVKMDKLNGSDVEAMNMIFLPRQSHRYTKWLDKIFS
jgi:hypothetical protein